MKNEKIKILFLFTDIYPYYPGEEFLDNEINYWLSNANVKIIIFPSSRAKNIRNIADNENILVSNIFNSSSKKISIGKLLLTLSSSLFFQEIITVIRACKINFCVFKKVFKTCYRVIAKRDALNKFIKDNAYSNILMYSYWSNESFFAALLAAKSKNIRAKVICRSHRYDLYEDVVSCKYMPLIRRLSKHADTIYFLSLNALDYAVSQYSIDPLKCKVARLGVNCSEKAFNASPLTKQIKLISVSHCNYVKRIDKIINAIEILSQKMPDYSFVWTHIGSGALLKELDRKAKNQLHARHNVIYKFKGYMKNNHLNSFYQENKQDFIINLSSSEGIPVSIMEAMIRGVIPIATNVGEVNQIVNKNTGILLSKHGEAEEVLRAIKNILKKPDSDIIQMRNNCKQLIKEEFNQSLNYTEFINSACGK